MPERYIDFAMLGAAGSVNKSSTVVDKRPHIIKKARRAVRVIDLLQVSSQRVNEKLGTAIAAYPSYLDLRGIMISRESDVRE